MDCQVAEVTDDEASVEAPRISQNKSEKTMDGVRPVTPTEIEQMREEIFKDKESESILHDDDKTVEEDFPTYAQDSQEYMHWHYRLNHPTHTVMTKMAKQGMLPRGITKILITVSKQHTKPPMCNDFCGAKATRKPCRGKGKKHTKMLEENTTSRRSSVSGSTGIFYTRFYRTNDRETDQPMHSS